MEAEAPAQKKSGLMGKLIIWLVVGVISIGGGAVTPILWNQFASASEGGPDAAGFDPNEPPEFIDIPEIVAVLGESRLSRYLKLQITLQVPKSQKLMVEQKIQARTAVLRNQIISHISEKTEEEIAGQQGHNRLRREFQIFFNDVLFEDGIERVQDIFFREFQVQ